MIKTLTAFLAFVCFAASAFAQLGTYTYTITGSTSSVTISHSTHGKTAFEFAVHVYDGNGVRMPDSQASVSANSYGDVTVDFNPSVSAGAIKITGNYGSLTTAARDFQPTASGADFKICDGCDQTNYALRSSDSKKWLMSGTGVFTMYTAGNGIVVRAYLKDNLLIFGVGAPSATAAGICAGITCRVDYGVYSVPSGAIALGSAVWKAPEAYFYNVSDLRPGAFQ
ncbi:MAG: hypothetical protein EPO02_13120 [Nitrospirae bacterium]|nr:MAG: hypothetical protein EPO02_13120 [Nitrospirota bacterium]